VLERLWIYQRERFPLAAMGLLAGLLACASTLYSALSRGAPLPGFGLVAAAAASALLLFVQMRVLDEFKDLEDDARFRPYRPVPRGLVSLRELGWILAGASAAQIALALAVDARLLLPLAIVWSYLGLMAMEFFARDWLRRRHFAYLASHNPIGALIALYAAAFEWLPRAGTPHPALALLALAVFCNTALLEIGRKIRAPQDEEAGVPTYSAVWGRGRATLAWYASLAATALAGWAAASATGHGAAFAALMAPLTLVAGLASWGYLLDPQPRRAKAIEGLSGLASLVLYAALGPLAALLGD
jgi:4-hydroxybenzoate polyprenyltransferase